MWIPQIGEDAGRIWQTLNEHGPSNLSNLKKITAMDDKRLFLALGWLAREDKVWFEQQPGQILVGLTGR